MTTIPQIRLTGRAARFLNILVELGHLDDDGVNQVVLSLHAPAHSSGPALADYATVRAAAAWVLAERLGDAPVEGALAEDWNLLFS